jgi:hypothetical protein
VQELTAEITSGRGDAIAQKGVPAYIVGGSAAAAGSATMQGPGATNVSAYNPLIAGVRGQSAQPTAGTTGRDLAMQGDLAGRPIMKPLGQPQAHDFNRVAALTTTTETTLVAAVASNRHEVADIIIANHDTVLHTYDLRDAAAGTIRKTFKVPAGTEKQYQFPFGLPAAIVNTAWTIQAREVTTTTGVDISVSSHRTTA